MKKIGYKKSIQREKDLNYKGVFWPVIENVKKAFQSLQLHFTVTQNVKTVQTSINSWGKKNIHIFNKSVSLLDKN